MVADEATTALQVVLARRHRWVRQIDSGKVAKLENVDRSYLSRMVNLTTLAPDIQAAILDETLPDSVSLFDLAVDMPVGWAEQRGRFDATTTRPVRLALRVYRPVARRGTRSSNCQPVSAEGGHRTLEVLPDMCRPSVP